MLRAYFASVLLLLAGCGEKRSVQVRSDNINYQKSVLNASPVDVNVSPQFVKILVPLASGQIGECSGTVVGGDSVLTAGHCFVDAIDGAVVQHPLFGSLAIESVIVHPYYREEPLLGAIFYDLAVVVTSVPLGLPPLGIEATLPPIPGEKGLVFGFGVSDSSESPLNAGEVPVDLVTPNHIFSVNAGGAEPCFGDSGGPLVKQVFDENGVLLRATVVGVVSSGSQIECGAGDITLFANIQDPDAFNFLKMNVPDLMVF